LKSAQRDRNWAPLPWVAFGKSPSVLEGEPRSISCFEAECDHRLPDLTSLAVAFVAPTQTNLAEPGQALAERAGDLLCRDKAGLFLKSGVDVVLIKFPFLSWNFGNEYGSSSAALCVSATSTSEPTLREMKILADQITNSPGPGVAPGVASRPVY